VGSTTSWLNGWVGSEEKAQKKAESNSNKRQKMS
jgi:hypothetical protein